MASMITTKPDLALQAQGLRKTYPGRRGQSPHEALKGVDLNIPRGTIFGLLGPNGAGKSTLINIFAGLTKKTGGSGRIWGFDIDKTPRQARAALGVVPQEINMDPFFSPIESLEFQAGFYGVPKRERRSMEILDVLGLADKAHAYVRELSGGMKRRLLIAKALVHNPPVLVLDEPTAGVDIELRRQLWDYVRDLHRRGATIVLTTHYLEEAQELCDHIAIIDHGVLVACDTKDRLLHAIDHKTLVIDPVTPLQKVPPGLEAYQAELREDGALAITYRFGKQSVAELIELVRKSGLRINDLRTEEPSLEDVFMALTYDSQKEA